MYIGHAPSSSTDFASHMRERAAAARNLPSFAALLQQHEASGAATNNGTHPAPGLSVLLAGAVVSSGQHYPAGEGGTLDPRDAEFMNRIARDPDFAEQQALDLAFSIDPRKFTDFNKSLEDGDVADFIKNGDMNGAMNVVQRMRRNQYNADKEQNLPPAQIYANLLSINANVPQEYGDGLGTQPPGDWQKWQTARFDHMQNAINTPQGATAQTSADGTSDKPESPYMWEIANDPAYAEKEAYNIGNSYDLPFFPTWEDVEAHRNDPNSRPFRVDNTDLSHPSARAQADRAELYAALKAQGTSSIDIIKEIYRFNASLPDSYSDMIDPTGAYPPGHYKQLQLENLRLLEHYEQSAQQTANDNTPNTSLPIGTQHGLDDIANDPEYAATRAKSLGTETLLGFMPMDTFPKNGDPDSVWNAFRTKMNGLQQAMNQEKARRTEFYESKVAENLPPAEIYAEMLAFIANDTAYNTYADTIADKPPGSRASSYAAEHAYLTKVLNKTATM